MIPGAVHRPPDIYLKTEDILGKPQLGDRVMKALRPVIASNEVPYLQMTSVGTHSRSGREKEAKNEGTEYLRRLIFSKIR